MSYEPRDHGARCDLCPLGGKDRKFVPPQPPSSKLRLIVVGEGPGRRELLEGRPFIGQSGLLLDDSMSKAGWRTWRCESWISNAALCAGTTDGEKDDAAACCAPRLLKELAALPKEIPILTLGKPAARAILGVNTVQKARGFVWTVREITDAQVRGAERTAEKALASFKGARKDRKGEMRLEADVAALKAAAVKGRSLLKGRTVLPTVHPAFILRSKILRPVFDVDIDRVARWVRKPFPLLDDIQKGRDYEVVSKPGEVKRALASLGEEISFDIETNDKDPIIAKIRCLGVSDGARTFVIFPWKKKVHAPIVSRAFRTRIAVGHNIKAYDEIAMKRDGVKFLGKTEDSLVAHHAYASHMPQSLAHVASMYIDAGPWKVTAKQGTAGTEKGLMSPDKLPPDDLCRYNACDCIIQIATWRGMQADLRSEEAVYRHDMELADLCQGMQIAGIAVDRELKAWLSRALGRRAARLLRRIRALTGKKSFNPYATADIRQALFDRFRAPVLVTTEKTGIPSTSALVLQQLAQERTRAGKLSRLILKFRGARGTRSRNVEGVYVHKDGRVHPPWKSFGTNNGRFSSWIQQLPKAANPKRPALEDRIREFYVAKRGHIFLYFDLSQAEMRMASYLSGDENFIRVCSEKDVHTQNALLIFPDARDLIINEKDGAGKDFRDIAKQVGFAVNYGAGAETLLARLNSVKLRNPVSLKIVNQLLATLHKEFKHHFRYIDRNFQEVEKTGFMRSPLVGRIRWFGWTPGVPEIANTPVQQGVADLMNLRLLEIRKRLPPRATLIFQGHDSALFECRIGEATSKTKALVKEVMGRPVELKNGRSFIMPIDFKEGTRMSEWGEGGLKKVV
jgi:uracil-DNA glycosylase family 4